MTLVTGLDSGRQQHGASGKPIGAWDLGEHQHHWFKHSKASGHAWKAFEFRKTGKFDGRCNVSREADVGPLVTKLERVHTTKSISPRDTLKIPRASWSFLLPGSSRMNGPGQQLRLLRERLGLTMRDVEIASAALAAQHGNEDFSLPPSRLSDIETKGITPSIFRLYSLAVIYRCDLSQILVWYGIDLDDIAADLKVISPPRSHKTETLQSTTQVRIPIRMDPGFDPSRTANLGRMVEQWGLVPLSYLQQFSHGSFTYGYIGTEDFTMYPLLPPGSFIQIDESKNKVVQGVWRSEYERPIYFIETRAGYTCCWCNMKGTDNIVLQPHPLSPLQIKVLRHPQDAEVIGQVVGVAMRLGEWRAVEPASEPKARTALN